MAQFDVHANRGARRADVPYVVLVQSALFDSYRRRVVVPLVRVGVLPAGIQSAGSRMHPVFDIHGQRVVLQPLDTVSV
ncbi:MAG TPA: CcdB family protein, partial [Ottowia sp.]|nr:CcdB family protein [Ottowia sp.]